MSGCLCILFCLSGTLIDYVFGFLHYYFKEFSNCTRTFSCILTSSTWRSSSLVYRKRYLALSCSTALDRSECRSARVLLARCSLRTRARWSERWRRSDDDLSSQICSSYHDFWNFAGIRRPDVDSWYVIWYVRLFSIQSYCDTKCFFFQCLVV